MKDNIRINVVINIVRTIVLTLLSFITFPWACRYLLDEAMGLYTWLATFVSYFLILAKIGLPNLAIRECVKVRDNKELLSNKAQSFFLLQMIATVLSFLLMIGVVFSVSSLRDNQSLIFILSLNFLAGAFSFEWIFIALEKQFYMSVRSIIVLVLSAILIIVFVTTPSDIYIYALLTVGSTILTIFINLIYVGKYISFKKTMPYSYKEYIRPLLVLFTLSFVIVLYNQTDIFVLGFLDESKKEVASYSVGVKGIDIIVGVMTALSTVFVPRSAYYYQKEDKRFFNNLNRYSINIAMFITIPAIITMSVLAKPICALISGNYNLNDLNADYGTSSVVLIILSSMMVTYSIGDMIYGQILLPMKKEKYYLIALGSGAILNTILSVIFGAFVFKEHPSIGIAVSTMIVEVLVIAFLFACSWKWIKKAVFNLNTLKIISAGALTILVSILINNPLLNCYLKHLTMLGTGYIYVIHLASVVLIDAIIYIGFLLLLKENLVYSFVRKKQEQNAN